MSSVYQRAIVGGNWADYTPTLGGFAIGNGTIDSRFFRTGKLVFVEDHITFGAGATFGSAPTLTLPSNTRSGSASYLWFDGTAQLTLTTGQYLVRWRSQGADATIGMYVGTGGTYALMTNMSSTAPFTFASGSVLTRRGFYEEA